MCYRILSVSASIGYGFPVKSLNEALKHDIDLIASDAGSMDMGPYYLGKGISYLEKELIKRDFKLVLHASIMKKCPLIIGSSGVSGAKPHLEFMLEIVKEVFAEEQVQNLKVAVIDSHIENDLLIDNINDLFPLGKMPKLSPADIEGSSCVAQMGIAPYITALDHGADVIIAGRSCDVTIFAADPIRRGYDPGIVYQAGHILECGAMSCDPGSGSDCVILELNNDGSASVWPPNKLRKATVNSVAAHSLYEENHPTIQHYPEGILDFTDAIYVQTNDNTVTYSNSRFYNTPLSIKIEGSKKIGERYISLIPCNKDIILSDDYFVYGKNGVEETPIKAEDRELGLLIKVTGKNNDNVKALTSALKAGFLHYGYKDRRTTAGNIAFPFSLSSFNFKIDNNHCSLVVAGTREIPFIEQFDDIKKDILKRMDTDYPELLTDLEIEILKFDNENCLAVIDTVGSNSQEAYEKHQEMISKLTEYFDTSRESFKNIAGKEVYNWSLFHILKNERIIRDHLFPIKLYNLESGELKHIETIKTDYSKKIGKTTEQIPDPKKINAVEYVSHNNAPKEHKPLIEMALIIRSKNAGINTITYDVFFKTESEYKNALASNVFTIENMAKLFEVSTQNIYGCFKLDNCRSIKVSRYRDLISGSIHDRDVFGSQQQSKLEKLLIPIY